MQNLREYCKLKFKTLFTQIKHETNAGTFLLVTDETSLKLLSCFLKMMEMVNYGISDIGMLTLKRKRFHKTDAIYLLSETESTVNLLLGDYQDEETAQYNLVHIFFTSKVSAGTMDKIAGNQVLLRRIKSFKEFNLEFLPLTATEYEINLKVKRPSLRNWLSEDSMAMEEYKAIERLSTLITTFPKLHSVEILYPKTELRIAERLAKALYARLADIIKELERTGSRSIDRKANKINLFVFDRSYDPVSPLVRDFHYLPMLADLKGICNFEAEYSDGKNKPKLLPLDQNDTIYKKYRYTHFGRVLEGVSSDFDQFAETNSTAKFEKGAVDNLSTNKLTQLMKTIPQYTEIKERYSLHIKLIEDLMKIYKENSLEVVGEVEQSMVTGVGSDGKKIVDRTYLQEVINAVNRQKTNEAKARLLVIALMSLDLKEKEKAYIAELLNLLGGGYGQLYSASEALTRGRPTKLRQNPPQGNLILDRYIPRVESAVGEYVLNGSKGDLSSLRINNDDRGHTQPLGRARNKIRGGEQEQVLNLDKVVVYMAGGLGFNEVRCLNKFSNKYLVISGSDYLLSPRQYLEEMKQLH